MREFCLETQKKCCVKLSKQGDNQLFDVVWDSVAVHVHSI